MNLVYEPRTPRPYVMRLDVNELILMRWHLNESITKMEQSSLFFDRMSKTDKTYKKVASSTRRDLRRAKRFQDELEVAIKQLKYA